MVVLYISPFSPGFFHFLPYAYFGAASLEGCDGTYSMSGFSVV
jgi:hypothetical protein